MNLVLVKILSAILGLATFMLVCRWCVSRMERMQESRQLYQTGLFRSMVIFGIVSIVLAGPFVGGLNPGETKDLLRAFFLFFGGAILIPANLQRFFRSFWR